MMKRESLTIGALARRGGVNVETVRYYQRRGLLAVPARPLGGIRRYSSESAQRLRFIKRAQQLGFTLAEVAELLTIAGGTSCSSKCEIGASRLADIERRIADLVSMRQALAGLVEGCQSGARDELPCPVIEALASSA
jgi:MerR family transcriptional regulator, mercuric resistance operon regulatory protein